MIPTTPNLPERYFTDFVFWYTTGEGVQPPWLQLPPRVSSYVLGRGKTWYSWHNRKCIELYLDFCVPIFYPNSYFPCVIFNFNETAYLMTDVKYRYSGCCVYKKPWSPPRPDFMKAFALFYKFNNNAFNISTDWWEIPDFKKGLKVPFGGYGWTGKDMNK